MYAANESGQLDLAGKQKRSEKGMWFFQSAATSRGQEREKKC